MFVCCCCLFIVVCLLLFVYCCCCYSDQSVTISVSLEREDEEEVSPYVIAPFFPQVSHTSI